MKINEAEDKLKLDGDVQKFKEWLETAKEGVSFVFKNEKHIFIQYIWNELKFLTEPNLRYLIIEEFKGETNELRLSMSNETNKLKHLNEMEANLAEKYNKQLGFSFYWEEIKEKIRQHNIPVIFHTGVLDIMFIMSHFENWVPLNFLEFVKTVNTCFPIMYDTKHLVKFMNMNTNYLEGLFEEICKKNGFNAQSKYPIVNRDQNISVQVAHNAGWDSYMTAVVFAEAKKIIEINQHVNQIVMFKNKFFNMPFGKINNFYLDKSGLVFCNHQEKESNKNGIKGVDKKRSKSSKKNEDTRNLLKSSLDSIMTTHVNNIAFSLNKHSEMEIIGQNIYYFVTFDKTLNDKQITTIEDNMKENFTVQKMESYYEMVKDNFQASIYGSK